MCYNPKKPLTPYHGFGLSAIESDDKTKCSACKGEGELDKTPCCNASFKQDNPYDKEDGFFCNECKLIYMNLMCKECNGRGEVV